MVMPHLPVVFMPAGSSTLRGGISVFREMDSRHESTLSVPFSQDASSTEFDVATPHPAVVFMPEGSSTHKGGTMRLGSRRTLVPDPDCMTARLYQSEGHIDERHRCGA